MTPTWRARDVVREVDAIEEIARFRLEAVPFTLPLRRAMFGRLTREQRLRRRVEDVLAGLGFNETYTPSLRAEDVDGALRLPEPISAELAVLRTRLLPSLVDAARKNREVGVERIALFEIARIYLPDDGGLPREDDRKMMDAIFYVLRTGIQWKALPREYGASSTAHDRFTQWREAGLFERLTGLQEALEEGVRMVLHGGSLDPC